MLGAVCALFNAAAEPIVTIYDATGHYPQCSQGPKSYIEGCQFPSDLFAYIPAVKPVFAPDGVNCTQLGYEYIGPEKVFTGFQPYWRGGSPAWLEYVHGFQAGHPDGEIFLNNTRDRNPKCKVQQQLPIAQAQPVVRVSNQTVAYYDFEGVYGGCSEGGYSYLKDCVMPSDYLAYMASKHPGIDENKSCAELGFELIGADTIFNFTLYWKGGPAAMEEFVDAFKPGHPDLERFLNQSRDENPSCSLRWPN